MRRCWGEEHLIVSSSNSPVAVTTLLPPFTCNVPAKFCGVASCMCAQTHTCICWRTHHFLVDYKNGVFVMFLEIIKHDNGDSCLRVQILVIYSDNDLEQSVLCRASDGEQRTRLFLIVPTARSLTRPHAETPLPLPAHSASLEGSFCCRLPRRPDVFLFNGIFSVVCKLGNDTHTPSSGCTSKRRKKIQPDNVFCKTFLYS